MPIGHRLTGPQGQTLYVAQVHNYAGAKNMHNLTIADLHTYYVIAGNVPVLVHNCGVGADAGAGDPEVTPYPIYRTPHTADLDHELTSGPNPASHQMEGGDNSVYFGEQGVAADYHGLGDYANGSIRYDMHPDFETEFADVKYRYDWKGPGGSPRFEWAIPLDRLDRFNELTLNRTWVPAGEGG